MAALFIKKLSCIACVSLILLYPAETAPSAGSGAFNSSEVDPYQQIEYCPGYRAGNPSLASDLGECKSGADIGVVDHIYAFGIDSLVRSPNWTACGIPTVPEENERVCYKTTVVQCADGYRVYLNRRNQERLQFSCPNETITVPLSPSGERFLQSPRYDCRKVMYGTRNKFFRYRKSDFCLYDVSIADCPSGRVVIDNELHNMQEVERRQRFHMCSDYLQFFTNTTASDRYCDSELSRLKLELPVTRFTALLWTDTSINKLGFKLRVSCMDQSEIV
jgi:hypothetical protein